MTWTTVPSIVIALVPFGALGWGQAVKLDDGRAAGIMSTIDAAYDLSPWSLLPLVVVLVLAVRKFPALPTIIAGALLGGVMAVILQPEVVLARADAATLARPLGYLKGVWTTLASGFESSTGNKAVDELLSRGGMESMLNTVWLIISAILFGAVLEHAGMLERLVRATLVAASFRSSIGVNAWTW